MLGSRSGLSAHDLLSSNAYATLVVGFAIMTDSMIYTLALPFLPDLFVRRLHVPERQVSQWTVLAFEAFAAATLLSNALVGLFTEASASTNRPFLISVMIMLLSTVIFFLGTTPAMIIASRAIQGVSTTFTWVTGLAFLVSHVGEGELGAYVGWTTVGVAIGEFVGPLVGGPIYDYFGHWAAFAVVEALPLVCILLRILAREKRPVPNPDQVQVEQEPESDRLLQGVQASSTDYNTIKDDSRGIASRRSIATSLAWNWMGTVLTCVVIFMLRGALEVALPLYLTRQYSWTPTKISLTLLTLTLPAVANPVIGALTSLQGPRWWTTGSFAICSITMVSFGNVSGHSEQSKILFVAHSVVIGLALAVLINANQVAISVAAQRYGLTMAQAKDKEESLGRILSSLSPSIMLGGVTTSWAAGILLGPAYGNLMPYTEDAGWAIFCRGLGGLCLVAAVGSPFIWRRW